LQKGKKETCKPWNHSPWSHSYHDDDSHIRFAKRSLLIWQIWVRTTYNSQMLKEVYTESFTSLL